MSQRTFLVAAYVVSLIAGAGGLVAAVYFAVEECLWVGVAMGSLNVGLAVYLTIWMIRNLHRARR